MNIEVTKQTFESILKGWDHVKTKPLELAYKEYFFNPDLDQKGIKIHNFVSNTTQYYLTDINA